MPNNNGSSSGFDQAVADQLTTLALTSAINQQQLNSIAARNQVGSMASVLTLNIQLTHTAVLKKIFSVSPLEASSVAAIQASMLPQQTAALNTAFMSPGLH